MIRARPDAGPVETVFGTDRETLEHHFADCCRAGESVELAIGRYGAPPREARQSAGTLSDSGTTVEAIMFAKGALLLSMGLICLSQCPAFAEPDATGYDKTLHHQLPTPMVQGISCNVLWYGIDSRGEEIPRLTALGFTFTHTEDPADLSATNLANYDVLVIAFTGPGVIEAQQPAISAFTSADNGLLIHQPDRPGAIDYAPAGFGVTTADLAYCELESATIVNGTHSITSGLTDSDLSGHFDVTTHLGAGYTVLATSNAACQPYPALAAGEFGSGRVVFETGNAGPNSIHPGSDFYWVRVFEWLCAGSTTPTENTTWGSVKILYR